MADSTYKREVYPGERAREFERYEKREFLVPDRVERIHTLMPEQRVERVHVVERENLMPESGRYRSRSPV